ncbi:MULTISPECIES: LytTR family DNA-binding domain-containing protein [Virgibacillus]|uniref:Putative HTH-type transcriptional regulator n=1 Tax=Virgibacillus massiliensis TaxID=1462526 RepID=A0A024QFW1_9BACI|nr:MULTISPECIES: LytTR family DNA-binding domain-containing protein [Virgibacillus]EQB38956.1 hypothetical protein M948_01005 [Virgibacillus sp. CM-4]MYL43317.1 LytTR family transcriptional regulator [Virgibacillus massiliensis]CDQ41080.1 putative HTH-type transcriptional regulator [Virgibacillus massiliensis]
MKVNIDIDDQYEETSITIQTQKWTDELEEIIRYINNKKQARLFGVDADQTIILNPKEIDYIYAEKRKIFAALHNQRIEIKMKLYEIEELLLPQHFMRFSKSVIGNLNNIQCFELSFNGNLCVYFHSGNKEYITRKYATSIKKKLATGGDFYDR